MLLQVDRLMQLPADLQNTLTVVRKRDYPPDTCLVVFGSWARGMAVEGASDVDLAAFFQDAFAEPRRLFEGKYRIEPAHFPLADLCKPSRTLALDALVNGIPLSRRDAVFDSLVALRTFPKSFLIHRLDHAQQLLDNASIVGPQTPAGEYLQGVADRALAQVRSILEHGRTVSWREVAPTTSLNDALRELRDQLAIEGDEIWLT
ncbi:MAG: nucleotidyltransferase domain-containing protein [Dehalococcoidia bacterium]